METKANQINLEVLKLAKELVENQYLDYRAKVHNKWLTESERLWDTEQSKLEYPDIDPYPTEEDIVAKAQVLLGFLNSNPDPSPNVVSSTEPVDLVDASSNVTAKSTTVEDTTASQPKQTKKPKVPFPPEDTLEWAKVKTGRYEKEDETSFSRVIPELMRALNQPKIV